MRKSTHYEHHEPNPESTTPDLEEDEERLSFQYNRLKAVQYAERWWNSYNPAYKKFESGLHQLYFTMPPYGRGANERLSKSGYRLVAPK